MLLEIVSDDDGEDDLGQVNEDPKPFGLSPRYNLRQPVNQFSTLSSTLGE